MSRPASAGGGTLAAGAFVWTVWGVMLAAALVFVGRFGSPVPVWDDFEIVQVASGRQPITAGWLWSQHNEHRVPLPRAVLIGLDAMTGHDARAGMVFSVIALALSAAGLLVAVRRQRGTWEMSDGALPILLLNWGHHTNFLWSWQVEFTLSAALMVGALAIVLTWWDRTPSTTGLGALGLCLLGLPLCGAMGTAFVPAPLLAGLAISARTIRRDGWRRGAATLLAFAPAAIVFAAYFVGYERAAHHPPPERIEAVGRALAQFTALGLGPAAALFWRWAGTALLAIAGIAALGLVRQAVLAPERRWPALALLSTLAGSATLALGLAWGRAGSGELAGLEDRYVTLAAPLVCALYAIMGVVLPSAVGPFARMVGYLAVVVLLWPNTAEGLETARARRAQFERLAHDVRAGVPASRIVRRYTPFLHPSQDFLLEYLPELRRLNIGPFAGLRDDPPYREVPLTTVPSALRLARLDGDTIEVTGVDPQLTFRLPRAMDVAGARLEYDHHAPDGGPAHFQMTWLTPGQTTYDDAHRYAVWALPTGDHRTTTVWAHEPIRELRIQPDNRPCRFRIRALTLLVPP